MDLKTQIEKDLHQAMRDNNDLRKRTLRMVLAAIKLTEVEKTSKLTDAEIVVIIQKEIKSRKEAIQEGEKANRNDLVTANQLEIAVLEEFLPQQFSDNELSDLIKQAISEVNAATIADMGKVMKVLVPRIQGRATNDRVSQMVRSTLQQ